MAGGAPSRRLKLKRRYLNLYRWHVEKLRFLTLPYSATILLARMLEWYHADSIGQLPALITPYKAAALWKGNRFSNALESYGMAADRAHPRRAYADV